jgi:hypothetical protein
VPDGMKGDVEGKVYCAGAGGIWGMDKDRQEARQDSARSASDYFVTIYKHNRRLMNSGVYIWKHELALINKAASRSPVSINIVTTFYLQPPAEQSRRGVYRSVSIWR